jgi:hypothetical protein
MRCAREHPHIEFSFFIHSWHIQRASTFVSMLKNDLFLPFVLTANQNQNSTTYSYIEHTNDIASLAKDFAVYACTIHLVSIRALKWPHFWYICAAHITMTQVLKTYYSYSIAIWWCVTWSKSMLKY